MDAKLVAGPVKTVWAEDATTFTAVGEIGDAANGVI
jgi:hypothetical protein